VIYCFETRTGQVCIDHDQCVGCDSQACVEACRRFGSNILAVEEGLPVLSVSREEARRRDTECLGCEIECLLHGQRAITISLPIAGLEEFRNRHGNSAG
jgi:hypothetical protein